MYESIKGLDNWLTTQPEAPEEYCEACGMLLEDCERRIPKGCIRCAECNQRDGDCQCDDDHLKGCEFPAWVCTCPKIAKEHIERIRERAIEREIDEIKENK